MQAIAKGYRGFSLIMVVNSDRIVTLVTMAAGIAAGAALGTTLIGQ